MLKELFKGSAIYGIAPYVPKILTVFLLPILTKYLTSVDYGIIGTVTSIVFLLQALQDLGLRVLLANYFYKCKCQYKVIWREIYGFLSIWMVFYALLQAVLLYLFIPKEAESNKWLIIILSNFSTVFFGPTSIIGHRYYQLNLQPTPVALRTILSGITTILTNFVCVVVFKWGYMGAYVGSFAGTFIVNLSYWYVVNKKLGLSPIYNFKIKTIKRLLKVSIPTIPHYYTSYLLNTSNILVMNIYKRPQAEIGQLTMARSISNLFDSALNAINQVFSPMTYRYIRDNNPVELRRMLYTYILMTYSMTCLYSIWAKEIYGILISNEEIAATYSYSIIFIMALNYRPLYVYCCTYFFYYEKTVQLMGITFVAGLISCAIYFLFIPYGGVYAALIGYYVGCLYFGYSGYMYKLYRERTIFNIKWYFLFVLQILASAFVYHCVDYPIIYKIPVTLVLLSFIGWGFYTRILNKRKINIIKR